MTEVTEIAVATYEGGADLTIGNVKQHIRAIQAVLKGAMIKDVHYGKIPGTNGMTLLKPGAELIFATFRLGTEPTITETGDGYRVSVRVFHIPTGNTVGYGMGSCSWGEDKYAWRKAWPGEFNSAETANRRTKRGRDYTVEQVRTNPCDLQNTVLKMAIKRARVDACLTVTAASDVFEQDTGPDDPPTGDGSQNGNKGAKGQSGNAVDDAVMLQAIEAAKNVDELVPIFDQINNIKAAKQKVALMAAYRERYQALGGPA